MTSVDVVVTYLELDLTGTHGGAQHGAPLAEHSTPLRIDRVPSADAPGVAATMYRAVGSGWQWSDRLAWTAADWELAINRDGVELWVARVDGEIVGYFELQAADDAVELKYFGLMPKFTGRGFGGALLSAAIGQARVLGKARMTVNTCTLDHPAALPNYVRRGFTVVRSEPRRRSSPT